MRIRRFIWRMAKLGTMHSVVYWRYRQMKILIKEIV